MRPTPRQRAYLRALSDLLTRGYSPTYREIGARLGVSANSASEGVLHLAGLDLVEWEPGIPRTLRITPAGLAELTDFEEAAA